MISQYGFFINALFSDLNMKHLINPKKGCLSFLSAYTHCAQYYDRKMLILTTIAVRSLYTILGIKVLLI